MIRIYMIVVVLALAIWAVHWFQKTPPDMIGKSIRKVGWLIAIALLLLLAVSGKLNWLFAVLGMALAFMLRLMPVILNYAPQVHRLWMLFTNAKQQQQSSSHSPRGNHMTQAEALEILGLKPGATEEEILQAHRKLIARVHPDRGGSDYLAAQINLAKKTLLQR